MSSDEESIRSDENDLAVIQEGEELANEDVPEAQDDIAEENDQNDENKTVVKPKRVIRNPQPKLNEQLLMGPRGLSAVEGYFDRVKFKGKGYEEQDLSILMKTYEYWCHRLFPKYPFNACIARLETLGTKRAAITQLKRIRMGVTEDEDKELDSDEEILPDATIEGFVNEVNDKFDQLLPGSLAENILTEEQLEQIRKNKERAELIRKEKLQKIRNKSLNLLSINDQHSQDLFVDLSSQNTQGNAILINNSEMELNASSDNKKENNESTEHQKSKKRRKRIVESEDEGSHELRTEKRYLDNQSQIISLTKEQKEQIQNKDKALKISQMKLHSTKENCDIPEDTSNRMTTDHESGTDDETEVSFDQIINIINLPENDNVNNDSTIPVS